MRTLIVSALALGLLLLGTFARAESAPISPLPSFIQRLTALAVQDANRGPKVCCQISGSYGNLFLLLSESTCLAVPGMPSEDALCRN